MIIYSIAIYHYELMARQKYFKSISIFFKNQDIFIEIISLLTINLSTFFLNRYITLALENKNLIIN